MRPGSPARLILPRLTSTCPPPAPVDVAMVEVAGVVVFGGQATERLNLEPPRKLAGPRTRSAFHGPSPAQPESQASAETRVLRAI